MYDFYNNPPKSKKEIREWLTDWLEPVSEGVHLFEQNGELFKQELGFRRAFHIHCVCMSLKTGEYAWCVFEDSGIPNITKRFTTYEEMLNHVIDDYYVAWKLTG